jgi:hypothetical protein
MSRKKILLIVILSYFVAFPLFADTVILKKGEEIKGIITQEDEKQIKIEVYMGAGVIANTYLRNEIAEVIRNKEENKGILEKYREEAKKSEEEEQIRRKAEAEAKKNAEELREKYGLPTKEELDSQRKQLDVQIAAQKRELEAQKIKMEKEGKAFRFGETASFVEYDYVHYQGVVYNDGELSKLFVKIKMKLYDSGGSLLRIEETYTDPLNIPPGGSATFKISIPKSVPAKTYKMEAYWSY